MRYDIEEIKRRADLERVADALGLQPKRSGRSVVCRCPAHNDQGRPNLTLSSKGAVKCFRCGFAGDVIALVAKAKGLETGDAIRWLADFVGVGAKASLGNDKKAKTGKSYPKPATPVPAPVAYTPPPKLPQEKPSTAALLWADPHLSPLFAILDKQRRDYVIVGREVFLPCGDHDDDLIAASPTDYTVTRVAGRLTFAPRKVSPRVTVFEAFLSHCTPASSTPGAAWLQDQKGISPATLEALGVMWLSDWAKASEDLKTRFGVDALDGLGLMTRDRKTGKPIDLRFKNHRLIFPFYVTVAGRRSPVYLQARNIAAKDKRDRFDNLPGAVPLPYNVDAIFAARSASKPVFVAEGVSDTLTLAQAGYDAVGIVGSQGFKPEWVRHFEGLDVYIVGDGDEAGRDFNRKVSKAFVDQGRPAPKIVKLPDGQDVTDFFTKKRSKEVKAA